MQVIKKILLSLLSIATGLLFIYSAYTKIYSIESFERFQYTIVEYVHLPWYLASVLARVLTGIEGAIGIFMIAHLYGARKWVLKIALALLVAFSIYLVYLWAAIGNDVNCGCFGDKIWMSPSSSLLKNVLLFIVILILTRFHKGLRYKWTKWITIPVFVITCVSPYFFYPTPTSKPSFFNKDKYELNLSILYDTSKRTPPNVELRKGKHIIAFMSMTCPHCKMAAYKMQIMKKNNPDLPIYFVLNGDSTDLQPFWDETEAQDVPNMIVLGRDFVSLAGYNGLPAILWVNNSWVEAKSNYIDLDQSAIENWLEEKKHEGK